MREKQEASNVETQVGRRIRELRKRADLSQEALALEAEIDRTYITSVENGRRNISIRMLVRICDALGVSLATFFSTFDSGSLSP